MEPGEFVAFGFYPFRRAGFHGFNDFGDRLGPGKPTEDVDMIADAANLEPVMHFDGQAQARILAILKARAMRLCVNHTGRASNVENRQNPPCP